MIVGQIDDVITDKLLSENTEKNLKILGQSNGVIVDQKKLGRYLVYLSAFSKNDNIDYYLYALALDVGSENLVIKKAVNFCTDSLPLHKEKKRDVDCIEIEVYPAPNAHSLFLFKIRQHKSKLKTFKDTIALLITEQDELFNPKSKQISLVKIIVQSKQIYDIKWHPYCADTFLTLGDNEEIEVWEMSEGITIPTSRINLKKLKKNKSLPQQGKFCSLSFRQKIQSEEAFPDYFSVYLSTCFGQVCSLFPFFTNQMILPFSFDRVLQNCQKNEELASFIDLCQCSQNEQEQTVICCEDDITEYVKLYEWNINGQTDYSSKAQRIKEQIYYSLKLLEINKKIVFFQFGKNKIGNCNFMKVSLIVDTVSEKQSQNRIYPIAKINFQQEQGNLLYQSRLNQNYLILSEGTSLFRVNIASFVKYLKTEEVSYMRKSKPFQVDCLLHLQSNQSIQSLLIQNECLFLVRSCQTRINFTIRPLFSLSMFDKIQNLNEASKKIFQKIKMLKIGYSNQEQLERFSKIKSLQISKQKIASYKDEGIKSLKSDYNSYCEGIKNRIDHEMSDLKFKYESVKNYTKKFKIQREKKNKLQAVVKKIKQNNQQIESILFPQEAKLATSTQSELHEYGQKMENLHGLIQVISEKELDIPKQLSHNFEEASRNLLARLKAINQNVKSAQKMEKSTKK